MIQTKEMGNAVQAIKFALTIEDHFDMRGFLHDWYCGSLDPEDWADYFEALGTKEYTRLL
jgi:hypothetical protein